MLYIYRYNKFYVCMYAMKRTKILSKYHDGKPEIILNGCKLYYPLAQFYLLLPVPQFCMQNTSSVNKYISCIINVIINAHLRIVFLYSVIHTLSNCRISKLFSAYMYYRYQFRYQIIESDFIALVYRYILVWKDKKLLCWMLKRINKSCICSYSYSSMYYI